MDGNVLGEYLRARLGQGRDRTPSTQVLDALALLGSRTADMV